MTTGSEAMAKLHAEASACLGRIALALERGKMSRLELSNTALALRRVAEKLEEMAK